MLFVHEAGGVQLTLPVPQLAPSAPGATQVPPVCALQVDDAVHAVKLTGLVEMPHAWPALAY